MHIVLLHRKQFGVKFILRFTCFYIYPSECSQCVSGHLCRTLLAMRTMTLLCWLSTFSTATSQWSQTCLRRQQSLRLAAVGNVQYLFGMCVNMVSTTLPASPFLPTSPHLSPPSSSPSSPLSSHCILTCSAPDHSQFHCHPEAGRGKSGSVPSDLSPRPGCGPHEGAGAHSGADDKVTQHN